MRGFTVHIRSVAIGLAAFMLFGTAVGLAGAQRPDGPPVPGDRPGPRGEGVFGALGGEFAAKLAEKLGVSEEALWTAFRETMAEMRPQIQERRGQLREHMREHMRGPMRDHMQGQPREPLQEFGRDMMVDPPRGPRPEGQPGLGIRLQPFGEMNAPAGPAVPPQAVAGLAADVLGLQPNEIMEQIRAGRTLAEIASERGISTEAFADQLTSRMEQMRVQRTRDGIRHMLDQHFPTPDRGPAPE